MVSAIIEGMGFNNGGNSNIKEGVEFNSRMVSAIMKGVGFNNGEISNIKEGVDCNNRMVSAIKKRCSVLTGVSPLLRKRWGLNSRWSPLLQRGMVL